MQSYLEWGVKCAVGVELSKSRHYRALKAQRCFESIRHEFASETGWTNPSGEVRFTNADILEVDLAGATVIWCASLLFSDDFMCRLALKLANVPTLRFSASMTFILLSRKLL